ncbi:MAG: hypothetical protein IPO63_12930 [Bacteroidetes bacterium]|nr:hypothetical protein [Bacteroidota bacterium]
MNNCLFSPQWKIDHVYSTDESLVEEDASAPFSIIKTMELNKFLDFNTQQSVSHCHYEDAQGG